MVVNATCLGDFGDTIWCLKLNQKYTFSTVISTDNVRILLSEFAGGVLGFKLLKKGELVQMHK
jgi:hypothetical protein